MDTLYRIQNILKFKNKSQKDLTDYLGLSKYVFSDWKSGKNTSYLKYIDKIAEFLGVSADYLLGIESKEKSPMSDDDIRLSKLFNDIKSLSPQQQEALQILVDSYKNK